VDERVASKWQHYHGADDFERGGKRMLARGWIIAEQRTTADKVPLATGDGSLFGLLLAPVLWLSSRTQPKEILHVRYEREAR
jgi:hypothetical protein